MKKINFASDRYLLKRKTQITVRLLITLLIITICIEGLVILGHTYYKIQLKNKLSVVEQEKQALQKNINSLKLEFKKYPKLTEDINTIQKIITRENSVKINDLLESIIHATSQKMWFSEIEYTPTDVTLVGRVVEKNSAIIENDLVFFEKTVIENPNIKNVRIIRLTKENSDGIDDNYIRNFKIILELKKGGDHV